MVKLSTRSAVTLIELLITLAVVAVVAGVLGARLKESGKTAALFSAQASTSRLFASARTLALSRGSDVVVLLNNDPSSPDRFLRFLAVGIWDGANVTEITATLMLPEGIYILPYAAITPSNPSTTADVLTLPGLNWDRPSLAGFQSLRSTALDGTLASLAVDTATPQSWIFYRVSPRGTTTSNGDIVLVLGIPQPRAANTAENPPVKCIQPDAAIGFSLSTYAQQTIISSRAEF